MCYYDWNIWYFSVQVFLRFSHIYNFFFLFVPFKPIIHFTFCGFAIYFVYVARMYRCWVTLARHSIADRDLYHSLFRHFSPCTWLFQLVEHSIMYVYFFSIPLFERQNRKNKIQSIGNVMKARSPIRSQPINECSERRRANKPKILFFFYVQIREKNNNNNDIHISKHLGWNWKYMYVYKFALSPTKITLRTLFFAIISLVLIIEMK